MKTQFFKPKTPQKITDLSWQQARARYPLMKPYGDADKDGLKNFRDCKPFDFKRKGEKHEEEEIAVGFEHIKDLKTVGDVTKLEEEY